ncbi:helix-turn-helix domain-containing protein [Burkholderia cenocepacia]|uniref:helix-turn-helix domain-containing protein n=1 Tax=Burkholderia cenocepacia TaxID=95486 RepID=UPI00097C52B0|nr:helix-turn-helix transcriptional regulator [Burkholderia cenocepacia]AQQ20257.1 hypothetical protein A8D61_18180 [Burkholderia cenocepacia]ONJ20012.1 hypothetical protein A8D82_14115 [Burkholderia cenocepacia]ONN96075.1 hypothetical protein A8D64_00485 [Burkholderia cenocepacia]ONO00524.1 hypothetical protein A8D62_00200 [Burkholderia cenocepacia]ONO10611.1 hypothetical protein A8D70_21065 [Burkholderia cenocepacia]
MNTKDSIGARIIRSRAGLKLSQAELAARVGIAPTQLSRYEMGKNKPRPEMIQRLAEALDVLPEWLETGEGSVNDIEKDDPHTPGRVVTVNLTDEQFIALRKLAVESGKSVSALLSETASYVLLSKIGNDSLSSVDEKIARRVAEILAKEYGIAKPALKDAKADDSNP